MFFLFFPLFFYSFRSLLYVNNTFYRKQNVKYDMSHFARERNIRSLSCITHDVLLYNDFRLDMYINVIVSRLGRVLIDNGLCAKKKKQLIN